MRTNRMPAVPLLAALFLSGCGRVGSNGSAPTVPSLPHRADVELAPVAGAEGTLSTLSGLQPVLPGADALVGVKPSVPLIARDLVGPKIPFEPLVLAGPIAVDLVIEGVQPGSYTAALLGIARLELAADGQGLPVTLQTGAVDLGVVGKRYPLAHFELPAGAQSLRVLLGFDQFGAWESGSAAGAIAAGNVLEFEVPIHIVAQTGFATIRVDVSRSLVSWGDEVLLLPQLQVKY